MGGPASGAVWQKWDLQGVAVPLHVLTCVFPAGDWPCAGGTSWCGYPLALCAVPWFFLRSLNLWCVVSSTRPVPLDAVLDACGPAVDLHVQCPVIPGVQLVQTIRQGLCTVLQYSACMRTYTEGALAHSGMQEYVNVMHVEPDPLACVAASNLPVVCCVSDGTGVPHGLRRHQR
jgi:hypothetical protein